MNMNVTLLVTGKPEAEVPEDDEEFEEGWLVLSIINLFSLINIYSRLGHKLVDTEFDRFKTEGIDPSLDPNTLTLEDPRHPLAKRRREVASILV